MVGRMLQRVWAVGMGPLGLQQCGISWFEILFLGVRGCRAPEPHGVEVPAGGGMLSGGMRIAHRVGFSQKTGQLTVERGWGAGSL